MRRIVLTLCAACVALAFTTPTASATVLKDVEPQKDVPRTGVVIVAPSIFTNEWELTKLSPAVVTNDAEAKRLGDAYARKTGVHYVEVIVGTEATSTGITAALNRLPGEGLAHLTFFYRGFGLGADVKGDACFVPADWSHEQPDTTCLKDDVVAELIGLAAPNALVVLDASLASPAIDGTGFKSFGPTADDWPKTATPVISSDRSGKNVSCNALWPIVAEVVNAGAPHEGMTLGAVTERIVTLAPQYAARCNGTPLQPRYDYGAAASTDVVIPTTAAPTVIITPPPPVVELALSAKPAAWKRDGKLGSGSRGALVTTAVCTVAAVGATAYGYHRLDQYTDPAWAAEHFPNDNLGRVEAGMAEIPLYGYTGIGAGVCAVSGAALTLLTW